MLGWSLILTHKLSTVLSSVLRQSSSIDQVSFLKVFPSGMKNYNSLKSLVLPFWLWGRQNNEPDYWLIMSLPLTVKHQRIKTWIWQLLDSHGSSISFKIIQKFSLKVEQTWMHPNPASFLEKNSHLTQYTRNYPFLHAVNQTELITGHFSLWQHTYRNRQDWFSKGPRTSAQNLIPEECTLSLKLVRSGRRFTI